MKRFLCTCCVLLALFPATLSAQKNEYARTDAFVEKFGALPTLNIATIADTLTEQLVEKSDKARAIFYWITHNITLDLKATRGNDNRRSTPAEVVQFRKATPLGFTMLFQEMCSMANIRCLSVDGYLKHFPEDINNKPDEFNHSWNVVQLGQSPEQWYYVDCAQATGYADKKYSTFTPHFTSAYFFADRALFNLDHYPDNPAWQMGGGPKTLKDFYALPVVSIAAYDYGIQKPAPATGYIKTKSKNTISFSFGYNGKEIKSIELQMGEGKSASKPEPMNFTANGTTVSFQYSFKREDVYPVNIIVDGKPLLSYMVESAE